MFYFCQYIPFTYCVCWINRQDIVGRREDGGVGVSVSVIVRVIQLLGSDQGKGKCMVRPLLANIRVGVVDRL